MKGPSELKVALIATLFVALGPISLSMYAPSMPALGIALAASPGEVKLTLTAYLVAFAAAQLICGPLSDRFGRKPILAAFTAMYIVGSLACAFAGSIEALILARVLQGIGACAGPALGRAMVRDMFTGPAAVRIMSVIGMAISVAPAIGPVLGGYMQGWFGWESIFLLMTGFGVVVFLTGTIGIGETNRRPDVGALDIGRMLRTYHMLIGDRVYMGNVLLGSFGIGGLFCFAAIAPFVMIDRVGLSPELYGWTTLLTTGAYFVGAILTNRLLARTDGETLIVIGGGLAALGAVGLTLSLSLFGPSVTSVFAPCMVWLVGIAFLIPGTTSGALHPFPQAAGAASALMGFLQMGAGAVASAVAALFTDSVLALAVIPAAMSASGLAGYLLLIRFHRPERQG